MLWNKDLSHGITYQTSRCGLYVGHLCGIIINVSSCEVFRYSILQVIWSHSEVFSPTLTPPCLQPCDEQLVLFAKLHWNVNGSFILSCSKKCLTLISHPSFLLSLGLSLSPCNLLILDKRVWLQCEVRVRCHSIGDREWLTKSRDATNDNFQQCDSSSAVFSKS